jgi:hypothetical protein
MHRIQIADPTWHTTFPFRIAPLPNEGLAGLLLRCDETNSWGSGTTLGHVLRPGSKRAAMNDLSSIVPTVIDLEALAAALAVPVSAIVATTYLAELARLYDVAHPHAKLLSSSFVFHVCPACVAEERRLSRLLTLPHITHCPQHQLSLVKFCHCGASLRLFHRQARPFTCHKCSLDWNNLPQRNMDPERLQIEQQLLSSYDFFFTQGTPELLAHTLRLIYDSVVEKGEIRVALPDEDVQAVPENRSYQRTTSLGYIVHALWQLDLSPRDILVYAGPLPWRSIKWITFQCPEPNCPYVTMIRDRTRKLDDTENHGQQAEQPKLFEP